MWNSAETGTPTGLGNLSAVGYAGREVFNQTFSAISLDRNTETLNRVQRVPAQDSGISTCNGRARRAATRTWLPAWRRTNFVDIATNLPSQPCCHNRRKCRAATASSDGAALFGEDIIQVTPRWLLTSIVAYISGPISTRSPRLSLWSRARSCARRSPSARKRSSAPAWQRTYKPDVSTSHSSAPPIARSARPP